MLNWYRLADMCYAYLGDVSPTDGKEELSSDLAKSEWFRRGWTLQELITSSNLVFIAKDWADIGHTLDLSEMV
jgi:hypothetical protein